MRLREVNTKLLLPCNCNFFGTQELLLGYFERFLVNVTMCDSVTDIRILTKYRLDSTMYMHCNISQIQVLSSS